MIKAAMLPRTLVLLALPFALALGQEPRLEVTRSLRLEHVANRALEVKTRNGSIAVERGAGQEVVIEATLRGRKHDRLQPAKILAEREEDGRLRLVAVWPALGASEPKQTTWGEGCSFKIRIPDASTIELRSTNGRLSLTGLSGPADLATSNGRIEVSDHEGPARLRTSNGRVKADRVNGPLQVRTSNGAVSVEDIAGASDLRTSNGKVVARGVGAALVIKTSNGSVTAALEDGFRGPVDVTSSNGSINLAVGSSFAGRLTAMTSRSPIKVSGFLPGEVGIETHGKSKKTLRFADQGAESQLRTSNGVIRITRGDGRPLQ